jgi:hypothetical protein
MKILLYLIVVVLHMQENPAPHTDFAGVGVRQGIWCAGFFCTRVPAHSWGTLCIFAL